MDAKLGIFYKIMKCALEILFTDEDRGQGARGLWRKFGESVSLRSKTQTSQLRTKIRKQISKVLPAGGNTLAYQIYKRPFAKWSKTGGSITKTIHRYLRVNVSELNYTIPNA